MFFLCTKAYNILWIKVEKLEKLVKDFMNEEEMCMGETIEEVDQAYRTSTYRKQGYVFLADEIWEKLS